MSKLRKFTFLLALIFLHAAPCLAQSNDDFKLCVANSQANPDSALRSCTAAIQSGNLSQRDLATAFNNRGNAYFGKGDDDHAIQDYSQAIRLNPTYSSAFSNLGLVYKFKGDFDRAIQNYEQAIRLNPTSVWGFAGRGSVYFAKGDYGHAIEDFDQAIRLNPRVSEVFKGRGLARFCSGQFALANADLAEALRLDPSDIYAGVWIFLGESKNSNDLKSIQGELRKRVPHPETGQWPGFVAGFFLGMVSAEKMIPMAKEPYPGDPKLRLCEAYFYVGEHSLIGGNKVEAAEFFQKALDTGGAGTAEFQMAKDELRRLKSPGGR
jgi:lipoprotein NlpI